MKRILSVLSFAIMGSLWMAVCAMCLHSNAPSLGSDMVIEGTLEEASTPCEGDGPCADCMTPVLRTDIKKYYLTTKDPVLEQRIDSLAELPYMANSQCCINVSLRGTSYSVGSYDYFDVTGIEYSSSLEGITSVEASDNSVRKFLRDGKLYIMYKGAMYDVHGRIEN